MRAAKFHALIAALALFVVWTGATWALEGRIRTLLRPETVLDRLIYVGVANVVIEIGGAASVLAYAQRIGGAPRAELGFGPRAPSGAWLVAAVVLGLAIYLVQGAPSLDPVVIVNAYAQVLAVSVAEVLVCWAAVGAIIRTVFGRARWAGSVVAAVVASALFGVYHFAHSPPFNAPAMVALLSAVGLSTSAFFFVSRDVYATTLFHNFLGVFGVVGALADAGELTGFATWQGPLLATAVVTALLLIAADVMLIRRRRPS